MLVLLRASALPASAIALPTAATVWNRSRRGTVSRRVILRTF